jgi:catechol 2,3-dioxygenase
MGRDPDGDESEAGATVKTIELGHAVLYVRDLEKSRHFYGEILGLPEIGPVEFGSAGPGAAAFSGGRTHHELLLIEVGASAASPPPGRRTGLYHLGFKIGTTDDELRDAIRELQDAGVTIVGASDHTVTHSLYIQDPDGNELELYIDVQPERWRDDPALVMAPTKALHI